MTESRSRSTSRYYVVSAFMLALLISGCGDANRAKIIGIWEIKTADKVLRRFKDKDLQSDQANNGRMQLAFQRGGQLKTATIMGDAQSEKEGSWEWVSFDESSRTAILNITLGLQQTEHEVVFVDDETIELIPPNLAGTNLKVQFVRKR